MNDDGIMIVDGVEFVNVVSVQARIDLAAATKPRHKTGEVEQIQNHPKVHNQGYTRGSVGLDLLNNNRRSVAVRLGALAEGSVPPSVAGRLTMSGLDNSLGMTALATPPAIVSH